MAPFLADLASLLIQHHGDHLDEVAVVLPSRRAGMHLRKYLAAGLGRPFWSPDVLDTGAFMQRITGLRQPATIEALFHLYHVHREREGPNAADLDTFLQWAPATLRDISEVDAHLLDLDRVYRDLTAYHEIETWSYRLEDRNASLSPGQRALQARWQATGELHRALAERLSAIGAGTSGAIARRAAETVGQGQGRIPWRMVWFAGHNALEPAPLQVIASLSERGLAKVAWDADRYYLDDPKQEAGQYLRRSIARLGGGEVPPGDQLRNKPRRIEVVAVPNAVAQARFAAQLLHTLSMEERARTAVVLANEQLLMPLLEALPPDIGPLNVTMGVPLRGLPVHGLAETVMDLAAQRTEHGHLPLAVLERLVQHPFLNMGAPTADLVERLRANGDPMPHASRCVELARKAGGAHLAALLSAFADNPVPHVHHVVERAISTALALNPHDAFKREQLYHLARAQRAIAQGVDRAGLDMPQGQAYRMLRERLLHEEQVGLFGEPLRGLQVMGLLETRTIAHDRVVLLGAEEGQLPRPGEQSTWIPYDVRRTYDLPLPRDAEAIGAYLVHRSAQDASELYLVHSADADTGGETRYIAQWRHELVHASNTTMHASRMEARPVQRAIPVTSIAKNDAVRQRLDELFAHGVSPSAFTTFLRCPLDFHFRYVLRLRQVHEVDETLGADILGEAVHTLLERLYGASKGLPLDPGTLQLSAGDLHAQLRDILALRFAPSTLDRGYFRLRIGMAAEAVHEHLKKEALRVAASEVVPIALESTLDVPLVNGVRIRGRCDRVEARNGLHHVLDIKTGSVKPDKLRLRDLDADALNADRGQAVQLLVYAWAYLQQHPEVDAVKAGIVPLRNTDAVDGAFLEIAGEQRIVRGQLPAIGDLIAGLVERIRDPLVPFAHAPESAWCVFCHGLPPK